MDFWAPQPKESIQRLRSSEPFVGQGQVASSEINAYASPDIDTNKPGRFHTKTNTTILDEDVAPASPYLETYVPNQQNEKPEKKMTRSVSSQSQRRCKLDFLKSTLSDPNQPKNIASTKDIADQTIDDYGFMQKFEMVEGVNVKYRQNALAEARKKLKKINIRTKIEHALDLGNGNQKEKDDKLLKLYNLHITEYASKQIQHKKENKLKVNGQRRVD